MCAVGQHGAEAKLLSVSLVVNRPPPSRSLRKGIRVKNRLDIAEKQNEEGLISQGASVRTSSAVEESINAAPMREQCRVEGAKH